MPRNAVRNLSRSIGIATVCLLLPALTRAALPGDANCDGSVDSHDLDALIEQLFEPALGGSPGCSNADVNGDQATSSADMVGLVRLEPPARSGPQITFMGLVAPDGTPSSAIGEAPDGSPIFQRPTGIGFQLVIEAAPGTSALGVGTAVVDNAPDAPPGLPDLQIETSRPLGEGTPGECLEGGVPATYPPDFTAVPPVIAAVTAMSCGFGVNTDRGHACTTDAFGSPNFVSTAARLAQFCLLITAPKTFPAGDTTLYVQLRDVGGNLGPLARMIVRVANPLAPTPTPEANVTPGRTSEPTLPASPTRTAIQTATRSATMPRIGTPTPTPTASHPIGGGSPTPTTSPTPLLSGSQTPPRTPTRSPTPPPFPSAVTRTPSATPTRSSTRTRTVTPSPTVTRTITNTAPPTKTPTITQTPTATVPVEPVISFFGVTRADDTLVDPVGVSTDGSPIFQRPSTSFSLVVEGRPGGSHVEVGRSTFNWDPGDPTVRPDLLIEASRALGNGSAIVCDDSAPTFGGVPGINPPDFSVTQVITNAINDFACRFKDGMGAPQGRANDDACTSIDGLYHFVNPPGTGVQLPSTIQFCARISGPIAFPPGDTLVTARIRDVAGHISLPKQLIIRVPAAGS